MNRKAAKGFGESESMNCVTTSQLTYRMSGTHNIRNDFPINTTMRKISMIGDRDLEAYLGRLPSRRALSAKTRLFVGAEVWGMQHESVCWTIVGYYNITGLSTRSTVQTKCHEIRLGCKWSSQMVVVKGIFAGKLSETR